MKKSQAPIETPNDPAPDESLYTEAMIFQQAICAKCERAIVIKEMRFFTERQSLETFALSAHNSLVKEAGLLCVAPLLTIFFGSALILKSALVAPPENVSLIG